jgi:phospholipid-binding lipoprotein MlaA
MKRSHFSWLLAAVVLLTGCASSPAPVARAKYTLSDFQKPDAPQPLQPSDPIQSVNMELYRFNYFFDKFLFLPVVNAYQFVMPTYAQHRVSNFFDNIGELKNFTNSALQLKADATGITLARFAINSTVGILGLWDPATDMGLTREDEDFGQTLGHYGVGNGPYLVLPIMGPSNLRDTAGLVTDGAVFSAVDPLNFDHNDLELPYHVLYGIDARSRQPFRYYESGSPFEYNYVRLLYTEKRALEIAR